MQYGPAELFPRAAELPAGPPSADAVLVTCAYLVETSSPWVMQSLFLAAIGDARDRGAKALETFAYRYREGESQYERFQVHKTIFPSDFLADFGLRPCAARATWSWRGSSSAVSCPLQRARATRCCASSRTRLCRHPRRFRPDPNRRAAARPAGRVAARPEVADNVLAALFHDVALTTMTSRTSSSCPSTGMKSGTRSNGIARYGEHQAKCDLRGAVRRAGRRAIA